VNPSKDGNHHNRGEQEYFLFSLSDNDFITQDGKLFQYRYGHLLLTHDVGHMNFGKFSFKDASGYNLDNQALVFKVKF
jgi:hypothetical protein